MHLSREISHHFWFRVCIVNIRVLFISRDVLKTSRIFLTVDPRNTKRAHPLISVVGRISGVTSRHPVYKYNNISAKILSGICSINAFYHVLKILAKRTHCLVKAILRSSSFVSTTTIIRLYCIFAISRKLLDKERSITFGKDVTKRNHCVLVDSCTSHRVHFIRYLYTHIGSCLCFFRYICSIDSKISP